MLKTFSLRHNPNIKAFLYAYLAILNAMIKDIWDSIEWKEWRIQGKKQKRLFPNYRKDNTFKRELRDKYLKDWDYAAHWVDSALKTAFSIMSSYMTFRPPPTELFLSGFHGNSISEYSLGMITKEDISNVSGKYNQAFFFHKFIADGILSEFRDRKVKIAKKPH